ncbi:TolC family protein [Caulifigura coniformis]|uniref:TolC family protein n=1 Tax=Caulifigura coniformis TaxID=2527983 RepID=UPI0018D209EE|nr:TolC family protein [Caulifigura coniformis]
MRPQPARRVVIVALCVSLQLLYSCKYPAPVKKHFLGDPAPAEYIADSTRIAHAEVFDPGVAVSEYAMEPHRLRGTRVDDVWDLTLTEAVHIALKNSRIIRQSGAFLSPGNPLFSNPDFMPTTLDPAIQETGVLYGQRGVEAALSEFDAQFTTSMTWGTNRTIQNNLFTSGGLQPGDTLDEDTANFSSGLQKRLANGAQVGVVHSWDYSANNTSARLFPSVYTGLLRAEYRQPLLAGGGVEFTRIAGPVSTNIQGVTGVQQGVIISRINNDIAVADFEQSIHDFIRDVETLYWQLSLAYRALDVEERLLTETAQAWTIVENRTRVEGPGGGGVENAEARDLCFETEARLLAARDNMYSTEAQLRRLLGLPISDGRIIRPADEPISAEILPDWANCLRDALARRPEIRRQKWVVKSLSLQLLAADNLTMPRLDLVGGYQLNGFGNNLLGPTNGGAPGQNLGNAYDNLLQGDRDGWNVGVEFSVPVGRRFALAQVRNLELRKAKATMLLEEQEKEISHEVAAAFRALDRTYLTAQNSYNRWITSLERAESLDRQYQADSRRTQLESVLRAKDMQARAEVQYIQSLIEYNTSLLELHYRTGRVLEMNHISLHEGPWQADAYRQANEKYEARQYAKDAYFKSAEPEPVTTSSSPAGN